MQKEAIENYIKFLIDPHLIVQLIDETKFLNALVDEILKVIEMQSTFPHFLRTMGKSLIYLFEVSP